MNCSEIAARLQTKLLHEREADWLLEAQRHAAACPSCSRLMELHRVEKQLAGLHEVASSGPFVENVMSRVHELQPRAVARSARLPLETLRVPLIVLGALMLAAAHVVSSVGVSFSGRLGPTAGLVRIPWVFVYFATQPAWVIMLAGIAALLVWIGLVLPDSPRRGSLV